MRPLSRRLFLGASAQTLLLPAPAVRAEAPPLRIAIVEDFTGPLKAYADQMRTGFEMGLEYASRGTMQLSGRKVELLVKDSQTKPDVGRDRLAEAFGEDHADLAVGGTNSAVALAMLPIAEEYKKILIVEPAVADSITGAKWNRYIFRTARNSSQDAISNALAIGKPGLKVATLAQDYAFGRDGVAAFRSALARTGAALVYEEYAPPATTDFTAPISRIFDHLAKEEGDKVIWVIWAGVGDPLSALKAMAPERLGIRVATGGNILPALVAYKAFPGLEGATYYYYGIPRNPINDWLVSEHQKRFHAPPDFFTCGGMSAALAIAAALEKTKGETDTETLIRAMEGLHFATPKGEMIFRPEDHQALQSMYGFRIKVDPALPWAVPELTHEFTIPEIPVPITNGR
jgi:branched-chain amino acid transport system substrate-binding protein